MNRKKFLFLFTEHFVLLVYFVLTTAIFFIAIDQGNEGVTLRFFGGGDDGFYYWATAQKIAAGQEGIVLSSIYPLIIGYLIKITGFESVYLIRIFNYIGFILLVMFSSYLIKMLYRFEDSIIESKYIYNSKILLLICFLLYLSLQMNVNFSIYRDIWIYTLYLISTIISIKVIFGKKNRFLWFILLVSSLWLLGEFRGYAMISFILSIIIYLFYKMFKRQKNLLLLLLMLVVLFGVYYTYFIDFRVPYIDMSLRAVLKYRNYSLYNEPGRSQMWINLDQPHFVMFFINYIYSYLGNLLGPLPWDIMGMSTLLVFLFETIPMLLILRLLWKQRKTINTGGKYLLVHSFVWIGLIAVSNDNIGTATRLRPVAWILILIVFTTVYGKRKKIIKQM